jgi:tetraacyldisaccharide-1-P 4'-kinase
LDVRGEIVFRDHHRYTSDDVARLIAARARHPGSHLVTTEKDAVNLGVHTTELMATVVPLESRLLNASEAVDFMLAKVAELRENTIGE